MFLCENPVVRGWEAQLDTAAHSCGLALELHISAVSSGMCTGGPARGNAVCSWVSPATSTFCHSSSLQAPSFPFLSLFFFFSPGFHGEKKILPFDPFLLAHFQMLQTSVGLSVSPQAGVDKSCSSQIFRGEKLLLPKPFHHPKPFHASKPVPKGEAAAFPSFP